MNLRENIEMITILGPTACGKTKLAARLAFEIGGEIISADSRQVYKEMNIGTGKDYEDYLINGKKIPYHLIDIASPGTEFNVYRYQQEFISAYKNISSRKKLPILCGGSGLYLESVLKRYRLINVPENTSLREKLKNKRQEELVDILSSMRKLHGSTDSRDPSRTLRAIEIETYYRDNKPEINDFPQIKNLIIGINPERNILRKRITERLEKRMKTGLIEEVKNLLALGISPAMLKYYGLEYKFLTMFLLKELSFEEMFRLLNTGIHQFAKRQMTWFRKMEKSGIKINWIEGSLPPEKITGQVLELMNKRPQDSLLKQVC